MAKKPGPPMQVAWYAIPPCYTMYSFMSCTSMWKPIY